MYGTILAATACAAFADDAEKMNSGAMNPGSALRAVERIDGGAFRVLVYGNSIALHAPKADIGWTNCWGMAASAPEKDFAHLVVSGLEAKLGKKADFRIRNLAALERNFTTDIATVAEIADDAAWKPDYVVIAIGENAPNIDGPAAAAYRKFLSGIARPFADAGSRIAMRSPFWRNDAKAACTKEAAAEVGAAYVDAGPLGENPENKAIGLFPHAGVANHPGDLGMRRIADLILAAFAAPRAARRQRAAEYDVAAYVWPAYQPEPRWAELGIFGDGIGEWQNVKEAVPKWDGHRQPLVPLWGYGNEADPKVVEKKIEAAVSHGVNVFIYDWYWYGGRPFLEDALDKGFLGAANNGRMKFFVMWANHHVNRLWDNKEADKDRDGPLWRGWADADEFRKMSDRWIATYFSRPNYYRIGGRPVLMIYEAKTFVEGLGGTEQAAAALAEFRARCEKAGLGGVHVMACDFGLSREMVKALGIDSATIYNMVHWSNPAGNPDYSEWAEKGARRFDGAREALGVPAYFAHASVGWDTNPRYPLSSVQPTVLGSTPEKFEAALRRAKDWCDRNTPDGLPKLVTVNSWNEWTEGSYLEPDTHFKFGYLEAVKRVFVGRPHLRGR